MIAGRGRALVAMLVIVAIVIAAAALLRPASPKTLPARPSGERPTLLLLTSLPLVFGEGFSLQEAGSPALKALQSRYRVVPISVADPPELARGRLLLMAHPSAQPAEDLVALDRWVRGGGRVLLLADPMLEWPSKRPLGDLLRPPPMFMDTGLLAHWGVRLDPPDKRGPKPAKLAGIRVMTISPGRLSGRCSISSDRLVADCPVGRGRAIIIADADFLDVADVGRDGAHNLDGLLGELAILEQP